VDVMVSNMARKKNTNFRLGLNRQELIEAAQLFGKKLSVAKKDSTKRLEEYITHKLGGRGTKVPDFTEREKRDIRDSAKTFGLQDALHLAAYRIGKITGKQDETNYLRLSLGRAFQAYYDGGVKKEHIDELMRRLPNLDRGELISGVSRHEPYYQQLFMDYAEELNP
jgi:hypothetical protein